MRKEKNTDNASESLTEDIIGIFTEIKPKELWERINNREDSHIKSDWDEKKKQDRFFISYREFIKNIKLLNKAIKANSSKKGDGSPKGETHGKNTDADQTNDNQLEELWTFLLACGYQALGNDGMLELASNLIELEKSNKEGYENQGRFFSGLEMSPPRPIYSTKEGSTNVDFSIGNIEKIDTTKTGIKIDKTMTNPLVVFCEMKLKTDISPYTQHAINRNQIIRNIDSLLWMAKSKPDTDHDADLYFVLVTPKVFHDEYKEKCKNNRTDFSRLYQYKFAEYQDKSKVQRDLIEFHEKFDKAAIRELYDKFKEAENEELRELYKKYDKAENEGLSELKECIERNSGLKKKYANELKRIYEIKERKKYTEYLRNTKALNNLDLKWVTFEDLFAGLKGKNNKIVKDIYQLYEDCGFKELRNK